MNSGGLNGYSILHDTLHRGYERRFTSDGLGCRRLGLSGFPDAVYVYMLPQSQFTVKGFNQLELSKNLN